MALFWRCISVQFILRCSHISIYGKHRQSAGELLTSSPDITTAYNISTSSNYAFEMLVYPHRLHQLGVALNARPHFGDLTITFNRPVVNPVIHLGGIGGAHNRTFSGGNRWVQGYYTEYELSTADEAAGITLTRLSGSTHFAVSGGLNVINTNTAKDLNTSSRLQFPAVWQRRQCGSARAARPLLRLPSAYLRGDGALPQAEHSQWSRLPVPLPVPEMR